jgi:hypothetical protein
VNALEAALRCIATDLDLHHRQWALIGGFAVSARAEPRFTRDIDVAVMVDDDADSEGLVRSLMASPASACPSPQQVTLIALKLLARDDQTRPQDLIDLRALMGVATASDRAQAQESVRIISERGYDRGRDLKAALEEAEKDTLIVEPEREPEHG